MSNFAQELNKHKTSNLKKEIEKKMDKESYKDFLEALSNKEISHVAILRALKSFGVETSETTIRRWREK